MWKRSMWMRHALFSLTLLTPTLSLATPTNAAPQGSTVDDAEPTRGKGHGPRHGSHHAKLTPEERAAKKREVAQKIDTLLIVELSTRLKLTDEKTLKLKDVLQKSREAREARQALVAAEREKLRALVDKKASDSELKAQSAKLAGLVAAKPDDGIFEQTAKFLTPHEQAELLLALPELRKEVRGLAREARGRRGDREVQQMDREERFERSQKRGRGPGGGQR
jgi:hypothetical protein